VLGRREIPVNFILRADIVVGTKDEILPIPEARNFQAGMRAKGVDCELASYEGQDHGFFNRPKFIGSTIQRMDLYLREPGYLRRPGPEAAPE